MEKHICWSDSKEKELEKRVLSEYSEDSVRSHLEFLTAQPRRPGTDAELRAANYIKRKLEEYGIDGEIYEFDAYVGQDGEAKLDILSPIHKSFPCVPRSFTAPTPSDGIEGKLIWLGKGSAEDYQGVDVKGKIVLIEPSGTPAARMPASQRAEENGAIAQIHIATGKSRDIHMGQIRYTWGNPTPDTIDQIPQIPIISVCNEDGKQIVALTKEASVVVRLKADAWRGYTRVRQPMGTLKGVKEPEKFVLFGGHYCSWYTGATDNAAANSLMLEMARIFSKHRKSLRRSIKFAWWTCHEQGTYAGSTWYADNFWEDIRDNAVAFLAIDGLARGDAPGFVAKYIEARNSEDIRKFNVSIINEIYGLEVTSKRPLRSGDQSFWGIGLPSIFGRPDFKAEQTASTSESVIWYSHTPEDTLDKVDMENLYRIPFQLNALSILRLCNNPILPFEFVTVAGAFETRLHDLQTRSNLVLDLTSLMTQVEAFKKRAEALTAGIEETLSALESKKTYRSFERKCKGINACLLELSRILMPILHSKSGKYGQDPIGSTFKPLPNLQPLEQLNSLDRESEEYKAWRTSLLRECNRVSDALNSANHVLDNAIKRT